jgi:hypothetical protein
MLSLALAVGLATGLSPWADGSPDGLEKVAESKGFLEEGRLNSIQDGSPVPDYAFPGIENERLATAVAGFAGTIGVFLAGMAVVWIVRRGRPERHGGGGTAATA